MCSPLALSSRGCCTGFCHGVVVLDQAAGDANCADYHARTVADGDPAGNEINPPLECSMANSGPPG